MKKDIFYYEDRSFFRIKPKYKDMNEESALHSMFYNVTPTDSGAITMEASRVNLELVEDLVPDIESTREYDMRKSYLEKMNSIYNKQRELLVRLRQEIILPYMNDEIVPDLPRAMSPLMDPRKHQQVTLRWMFEQLGVRDTHAILFDMGIGKTYVSLVWAEFLIEQGIIDRAFVLAPLSTMKNAWRSDIRKFTSLDHRILWSEFTSKKKQRYIDDCFDSKCDIILCNPSIALAGLMPRIIDWGPDLVIVDESAGIKNWKSKTLQKIKKISESANHKMILNGSPAPNGIDDYYGQFEFLDNGIVLDTHYKTYREKYQYNKFSYNWVPKRGAEGQLADHLAPFIVRFMKKDVLDLPERTLILKTVKMGRKQGSFYKHLCEDQFAEHEGHQASYEQLLPKFTKLRQATSGFFKSDEGEVKDLPSAKMECLEELVDEMVQIRENKGIIWCSFQHEVRSISAMLKKKGINHGVAYGGQTPGKTMKALDKFLDEPEEIFLVAHPASVGVGTNMQCANYMFYFSLSDNLLHFEQSFDRNYRDGQERPIFAYFLVARNTRDEKVVISMRKKQRTQTITSTGFSMDDFLVPNIENIWESLRDVDDA